MSEIEKLYENAGIKICKRKQGFTLKDCTDRDCKECGYYDMPPFTAEKQMELIKWLIINRGFEPSYDEKEWGFSTHYIGGNYRKTFEKALANLLNKIWQDLTDVEKEQIRDILKG